MCYGGAQNEEGHSIAQTSDGGYILAGARENGANGWDFHAVKIGPSGSVQWQDMFGGTGTDKALAVIQTNDNGYILMGYTYSNNGDVTTNHGGRDVWIVRLDSDGELQWEKSLGGTGGDYASTILQTLDGGFILAATTSSSDGDVTMNYGEDDIWLVKLDSVGAIQWERSYGGSGHDSPGNIRPTADGGYVLIASTLSNDGHVTNPLGDADLWIVKLDDTGDIQWQKTYGGSGADAGGQLEPTSDGGYIIAAGTNSTDGDVTVALGNTDIWLVKIDATGALQWQKSLGGSNTDAATGLVITAGGEYVIGAYTASTNGDVTDYNGGFYDYWIVKVDASGALIWQQTLGGSADDRARDIRYTTDGGYIITGFSNSTDGDVTDPIAGYDVWVVKLESDPTSIMENERAWAVALYPNPAQDHITLDLTLANAAFVQIALYNAMGQQIRQVESGQHYSGDHTLRLWIADLASGIYQVRLAVDGTEITRKVVKM